MIIYIYMISRHTETLKRRKRERERRIKTLEEKTLEKKTLEKKGARIAGRGRLVGGNLVNRVGLPVEGVGASVHHIDRGGTPGCLYSHSHSLSSLHTYQLATCTCNRINVAATGAHGEDTRTRREGEKYWWTGGEHITYNTRIRRVREVEAEKGRQRREKYIGIRYRTEFRGGFRPTVQRGLSAGAGRRVRARGLAGAAGEGWPQRAGVARKGGR